MSLLAVSGVSFAYACGSPLFEGASFSINPSDRIAIVGPNGAGKSTLLRLLAGDLEPSSGEMVRRDPLAVAVASQDIATAAASTLFDFVFDAVGPPAQLRNEIHRLESQLADPQYATEYATRIHEYGESGGYAAEAAVARILAGLGWPERDFNREIGTLSGGERARACLARALSFASDLLILDEPANHLDVAAREWLEGHLRSRQNAIVFTSHDRALLAAVATRVVQIERGTLRVFEGSFSEYQQSRAILDRQAWDSYHAFERRSAAVEHAAERRQNLARRVAATPEGGSGVRNPFYAKKASKVARTARILRERLNDDARVAKPWQDQPIEGLSFDHVAPSGEIVVSVRNLSKSYGGRALFSNLSFVVRRGERLVVRGANGAGKTTLLKLILGSERPDSGTIHFGTKVQPATVEQDTLSSDPERSALDVCGTGTNARTLLACLKLRPDRLNSPLRDLSGGERTKVALARVLDSGANLLLLDEPTNHLEIEAQEALQQALDGYPGALIVVSHDRGFVRSIGAATYLDM